MKKILFFFSLCLNFIILQAMKKQEEEHLEECFIKQKIVLEKLKQENQTLKHKIKQEKLEKVKLGIKLLDTQIDAATVRRNNITRRINALNDNMRPITESIDE